jgi:hypothetical protein
VLGLEWSDGAEDGGLPVIDYRVSIAEEGQAFSELESNVILQSYTAISLTSGTTYEFKIESRNSYGYSDFSDSITLLAAFTPEAPVTVATANSADQIIVTWSMPETNGSPITGYKIYVQEHGTSVFTQETSECDGSDSTVITDRTCSISLSLL